MQNGKYTLLMTYIGFDGNISRFDDKLFYNYDIMNVTKFKVVLAHFFHSTRISKESP